MISAILDFFTFAVCPPYRQEIHIHTISPCISSHPHPHTHTHTTHPPHTHTHTHTHPHTHSETTEAEKFDMVLELISGLGRTMFKLFQVHTYIYTLPIIIHSLSTVTYSILLWPSSKQLDS